MPGWSLIVVVAMTTLVAAGTAAAIAVLLAARRRRGNPRKMHQATPGAVLDSAAISEEPDSRPRSRS